MTDPNKILIIRLLYIGITPIMFSAPQLVPYVAGLISIILENGLTPEAYYITALYAVLRILQGDIALPYQLGEFIMEFLDKEANLEGFKARVYLGVGVYLRGNKQHYKKACKLLIDAFPNALSAGDLENAGYLLAMYIAFLNRTGLELVKWEAEVKRPDATGSGTATSGEGLHRDRAGPRVAGPRRPIVGRVVG